MSADGEGWLLCNASPDVAQQIDQTSALHPRSPRHTPIRCVVLTNGDVDHVVGLFSLRESQPLALYATETVWAEFARDNVLAKTLQRFPGQLTWRPLRLDAETPIEEMPGVTITARAIRGKRPVHLELARPGPATPEHNIAVFVRSANGDELAYVPAAGALERLVTLLRGPHAMTKCLLLDGTFWSDDELERNGVGTARARDMAHVPISGASGSLEQLAGLHVPRRIFTHINNTNPILRTDSAEYEAVCAAGWEVAYDGMEVTL